MATPTAPTVVLPPPEPAPAPAAPTGPLAAILSPVQPARPVPRIGSTASLAEESIGAPARQDSSPKAASRNSAQDGPFGALVRAIAARLGRTGTTMAIKRQHTVNETRVSGNSTNTTNRANRNSQRAHSTQQHGQHQTARAAKLADLRNKAQQSQDRSNRDARSSDTRGATHDRTSRSGRDLRNGRDSGTPAATTAGKGDAARPGGDVKAPATTAAKKDSSTGNADHVTAKPSPAKEPRTGTTPGKNPAPAPRNRTQPSREAGYRDGTRGAAVVGHVKAWRNGAEDGYADRTAADQAEKQRMDDAKARNARQPVTPTTPPMAPVSGTTIDLTKKPTPSLQSGPASAEPVQLTGLSDRTVTFDAGDVTHTMSRGEVRTLKAFERRMAAKAPVLQKVAEDSKVTRVRAVDQAVRAQKLAEEARSVEGGERLVGRLQRLAEKAHALRTKSEEIEKAALRGAEAVAVLVANANTRHGGIYRAVVDSPLTKPAEREFYQDKEGS